MLSIDIYFRRHPLFAILTLLSCDAFSHIQKFAINSILFCFFAISLCMLGILHPSSTEHYEAFQRDGFNIFSAQLSHSSFHLHHCQRRKVLILLSSFHLFQRQQRQKVDCRSGEPAGRQCKDQPGRHNHHLDFRQ